MQPWNDMIIAMARIHSPSIILIDTNAIIKKRQSRWWMKTCLFLYYTFTFAVFFFNAPCLPRCGKTYTSSTNRTFCKYACTADFIQRYWHNHSEENVFNHHHIKWRHIVIWCACLTGKSIYDLSHRRTLRTLLWSRSHLYCFVLVWCEHGCSIPSNICKLRPQRKTWSISWHFRHIVGAIRLEIPSIFGRYIIVSLQY